MKRFIIFLFFICSILVTGCGNYSGTSLNSGQLEYSKHVRVEKASGLTAYIYNSSDVEIVPFPSGYCDTLGDDFFEKKARGKFILVPIAMRNEQQDAITVDSNCFKLVDMATGTKYSVSVEGELALRMTYPKCNSTLVTLNPGLDLITILVFDVPESLLQKKIGLLGRGGFTGREVLMDFQQNKIRKVQGIRDFIKFLLKKLRKN